TPEYSLVKGTFYDNETGEVIEEPTEEMKEQEEMVQRELSLSDKVLFGDLLRFYTPNEDWEPVDTSIYHYGNDEPVEPAEDAEKDVNKDTEDEEKNEEEQVPSSIE